MFTVFSWRMSVTARGRRRSCWRRRLTPPQRQHRHAITECRKSRPACLSLHRARFHVAPRSNVAEQSTRAGWRMTLARDVGGKANSPLRGSTGGNLWRYPSRLTVQKLGLRSVGKSKRESGQLLLAATRRRRTVRTHYTNELSRTLCPQTPRRIACAPCTVAPQVLALRSAIKESGQRLRAGATVPSGRNAVDAQFNFGLRTAGMKDANPVDCTRAIIFNAAPKTVSASGASVFRSPPSPRATMRPTARFIEI